MRVALITVVHGRHAHLSAQAAAISRSVRAPDHYVVVAMDDPAVAGIVPGAHVVHVPRVRGCLPLAMARNVGVARARQLGTDLLVLLDVDCLPAPELMSRYTYAAGTHDGVLCGPVGYLPAPPEGGYPTEGLGMLARPHPARPVPAEEAVEPALDPDLFWSLSFALRPGTWDQVGGFCEYFYGYGGEDTDFGQAVARAGEPMWWVGGAWAYHQHHGDPGPPVRHLTDIVRNAQVFYERWGWWPMRGWLEEFARLGLVRVDPDTGRWVLTGGVPS